MPGRKVVIAGVAESRYGDVPDATHWQLHREAAVAALSEAGLTLADVDGVFSCGADLMHPLQLAEYLGVRPGYVDGTQVGGSSWEFFVHHAVGAIEAGLCDVALLNYATTSRSDIKRKIRSANIAIDARGPAQFESAYGHTVIGRHAMAANRHMFEYGTTSEQLAEIAVSARYNAGHNPKAMYRDPLTIEDVLGSRMIASPLHKFDCCIRSDGGGAVVLVAEDRIADLPKAPVRILGAGEATSHHTMSEWEDFTVSPAAASAVRAFGMAGVKPADIDVLQLYENFTGPVLMALCEMGFCKPEEVEDFVAHGALEGPDARLPFNTSGGNLAEAYIHGLEMVVEAVRQVRGESTCQAPDVELSLAVGGPGYAPGSAVLFGAAA